MTFNSGQKIRSRTYAGLSFHADSGVRILIPLGVVFERHRQKQQYSRASLTADLSLWLHSLTFLSQKHVLLGHLGLCGPCDNFQNTADAQKQHDKYVNQRLIPMHTPSIPDQVSIAAIN